MTIVNISVTGADNQNIALNGQGATHGNGSGLGRAYLAATSDANTGLNMTLATSGQYEGKWSIGAANQPHIFMRAVGGEFAPEIDCQYDAGPWEHYIVTLVEAPNVVTFESMTFPGFYVAAIGGGLTTVSGASNATHFTLTAAG